MRCLGLLEKLFAKSKRSVSMLLIRDYASGKIILDRDLTGCEKLYGAPWLLLHRADYMDVLLDEAGRLGVQIKLGCEVQHVECHVPRVELVDGTIYHAHVVVGCDGIHSTVRGFIHPSVKAARTGGYAYRAVLTRSQLCSPSLRELVSSRGTIQCWLGPGANAVLYPLQDGKLFNLVIPVADAAFNRSYDQDRSLSSMLDHLCGWDPVLTQVLKSAPGLARFPMYEVARLPHWSQGSVTLVGDAAHPMLPHLAQGAAVSVEDGYIVGTLLGRLSQHIADASAPSSVRARVSTVFASYEASQYERAARVVSSSRLMGTLDHLAPGPHQRARDAEFASYDAEETVSAIPSIDARFNKELLGRKVDQVVEGQVSALMANGKLGCRVNADASCWESQRPASQSGASSRS
ncbi:uncharacterized protein UV8b_08004 [Ustilaginoidea virens]|uniref:FAD-binding domain-containing protein n=1 Tax=Ustilaginoidea virens TaxID=1159556 RepID=A0A8E5MKK4_USTVR|nr:uncharacterized protein UV8b_08004 [Ustilaginoidea virens]QUC23763.1 hypothetical protein UV8b_08004 [Ustilaginoidea virens]